MTVKLIGLLLIAAGAGGSAYIFLRCCRSQICSLRSAAQMLELIEGELDTSALPLSQLLETISPRLDGPALRFARLLREGLADLGKHSFAALWEGALGLCFPDLEPSALRELNELGAVLGRYELSRQTEALSRCRQSLRRREELASSALTGKRRLALGLAFTAAAMLGIILF
ncbi:MAG: stage III sporulation protein AB [Eubacteriales bacterium]|nr:stage III sporulation protein AB [Eubacteriales bacterium]